MREEDNTQVKHAVEQAGFYSTLQPSGGDGVWIVLVSRRGFARRMR